jgi:hypothetical protein
MRDIFRATAVGALAVLLLAAAASCGGHHLKAPNSSGAGVTPLMESSPKTLQDALCELDALEKPEDVDVKLWDELKDALKSALTTNNQQPITRLVSTPPSGPANMVNDLTATRETNGDFTLSWHYRNTGDYDQNGAVSVSDLTSLAQHFGETYDKDTQPDCIQAVIDGSGNGKVDIADITPIAQNFGISVARYSVQGADAMSGPFAESATEGVGMPESGARKVFSANIGSSPKGYWQVVAEDADGAPSDASNIAGISLQILSVTPTSVKEGTVVTFSAGLLGAGPFTYEWDFGGQAVPATSTEAAPKVVLTRDIGGFPARVTVTSPLGNASYPFTLTKLAREWKYEVVWEGLQPASVGTFVRYSLLYENQELWFYVADSTGSSERYILHGHPNSWTIEDVQIGGLLQMLLEVDANGQPFIMYTHGSLLDRYLAYAKYNSGDWITSDIAHAMAFDHLSLTNSGNESIYLTYSEGPSGDGLWPIRFWSLENNTPSEAIIDFVKQPSYPGQSEICSAASASYSLVSVYLDTTDAGSHELTCASRSDLSGLWEISSIEADNDSITWKTGLFPAVKYDYCGNLGLAYSQITQEITPGVQYDKLIYRRFNSGIWSLEEVNERSRPSDVTSSYEMKALSFDPLGYPVIAYEFYKGTAADSDRDIVMEWKTPGGWIESVVYEAGSASTSGVGLAFDDNGTPYVLYGDKTNQEVVLARYE